MRCGRALPLGDRSKAGVGWASRLRDTHEEREASTRVKLAPESDIELRQPASVLQQRGRVRGRAKEQDCGAAILLRTRCRSAQDPPQSCSAPDPEARERSTGARRHLVCAPHHAVEQARAVVECQPERFLVLDGDHVAEHSDQAAGPAAWGERLSVELASVQGCARGGFGTISVVQTRALTPRCHSPPDHDPFCRLPLPFRRLGL